MKNLITALVFVSAFLVLVACGANTPTPIPPTDVPPTETAATIVPPTETAGATEVPPTAPTDAAASNVCAAGTLPTYLKDVVLAKNVESDSFKPIDPTTSFDPTQAIFHAIVSLDNAPRELTLDARWYLVRATGYQPNTKISEKELSIAAGGTRNVDFTLKGKTDKWPGGSYCVEIYANGNLALSKTFQVVGDSTPSNAGAEIVKQVVLAEDTKPSTFEPITPTVKFASNAPFIHAAVQLVNAPANTTFRARWYPPGQDPLDFNLQTDGSRWLDFRLTPAPDGFPKGEYKVEIYVNEQLANTQTFTVE